MGRQDDSTENQTLSGGHGSVPEAVRTRRQRTGCSQDAAAQYRVLSERGGMAPDALRTRRLRTRHCEDAEDEEVCAQVASGFRVETKANQEGTSDRGGVLIRN